MSMREAADNFGFSCPDVLADNYHLVVIFGDATTRDDVNRKSFIERIQAEYPNIQPAAGSLHVPDWTSQLTYIHGMVCTMMVDGLLDQIEQEGHLDHDAYWAAMAPAILEHWVKADLSQRIEWVKRTLDEPPEAILDLEPSTSVSTVIWQDVFDE